MKKLMSFICKTNHLLNLAIWLLTVASVFLVSCSSDLDMALNEDESKTSIPTIVQSLQDYNNKLSTTPQTRGIGWAGWLSVVLADGSGAYNGAKYGGRIGAIFGPNGATAGAIVGGVVVGGAASYNQYRLAEKISNFSPYSLRPVSTVSQQTAAASYVLSKETINPQDYTLGLSNGLDSCSITVAIYHNKILEKIELVQVDSNQHLLFEHLDDIEKKIVSSKEFETVYNSIANDPLADYFDPNLTSDQVMKMFISAISNYCKSQNDINQIISHYTFEVKASDEISTEEKEWLYTGFAVMGYSFAYWSEEWPYEQ